MVKPISGLDVDALLGQQKKGAKITPGNAIPEFKQTLAAADEVSTIEDATRQMAEIVTSLIRDSFADINYDRAAENIRVMREELINLEEPGLYNNFIRSLKTKIKSGELNGDREEMWREKIVLGSLGLITGKESDVSEVTEEEAKGVS